MQERTEEEKLTQAPLKVTLGGVEYKIAPLVIKYSGEWRKNALPLISFLIGYSQRSEQDMLAGVEELFGEKQDAVIESFFEYARFSAEQREKVETSATDVEILTAFMEVFNAFVSPLSKPVKKAPARRARKNISR